MFHSVIENTDGIQWDLFTKTFSDCKPAIILLYCNRFTGRLLCTRTYFMTLFVNM